MISTTLLTEDQIAIETPWEHGGKPWEFWEKNGQFMYIFGEAFSDYNAPSPIDDTLVKIGITVDPRQRLKDLRKKIPHGIWYDITWMESSAPLVEATLQTLLGPWRYQFEREWFVLPYDIFYWCLAGLSESWHEIAKHDRIYDGRMSKGFILDLFLTYYPADWLTKRTKEWNLL